MTGGESALDLVLSGDPGLLAIVRLSLLVSLSAVLFAAVLGVPVGAFLALTRFRGREAVVVILNALMGLANGACCSRRRRWSLHRPCSSHPSSLR
jgi:tungstate transport system permease protein